MRRDSITTEAVEACVLETDLAITGSSSRMNYWKTHAEGYLRVTIAEEVDRLVVVTVTLKKQRPR
jgi:hypothetical protein